MSGPPSSVQTRSLRTVEVERDPAVFGREAT
jgi:hypothetical protein